MRMVQQSVPDVQSFLLENKQAILTFLSNYSESSNMARDQSRSMSRSVSPVANGRGGGKSISRSRSRSGSPVVKSNRRGRSSSVDRRRRSLSGSRSPVRRSSRSPVRRGSRSPARRSRSPRRDRRSSRSPRRDRGDTRRYYSTKDRSPPRDFYRGRRYRDGRDNPEPCRCIGVFGMSLDTSEKDLERIFSEFGDIETVKVIRDHATGRSRGFGFVYYEHTKDASRAKKSMSDAMIDGMRVRVDYSVTSGNPGSGKGGRSHGGRSRSRSPIRRRSISHSPRRRSGSP